MPLSTPLRSRLLVLLCLGGATLLGLAAADNPVASVQRSLKEQGFYYAEPSGQLDEETRSALKRFQIRNSIKVTGEADNETLQALAAANAGAPRPPGAPPPSARERALGAEISDREFLADVKDGKIVATPTQEAPAPTPRVQPAAPRPPAPTPLVEQRPAPAPRGPDAAPPSGERPPVPRPDPRGDTPTLRDFPSGEVTPAQATLFVQSYLRAAEAARPEEEVAFYADRVDYFDSGRVPRQFVAQDQASYYRRWPNRRFELVAPPELLASEGSRATVRFRIRYAVSSERERASGATENVMQLQQKDGGLVITGIRERKMRD